MKYPSYLPIGEIRAAAILTGSYVVAKTFGTDVGADYKSIVSNESEANMESTALVLDVDFTIGSLTTCDIKVEFSTDGTNWYQEASEATVAGISTVSARVHQLGANFTGSISIETTHPFMRASAIGNGTATGSSLAISAHFINKQ